MDSLKPTAYEVICRYYTVIRSHLCVFSRNYKYRIYHTYEEDMHPYILRYCGYSEA